MSTIATTSQPATFSALKRLIVRHPMVAFFVLAFAGTWIVWLPLVIDQNGLGLLPFTISDALSSLVFLLGIIAGPTLSALMMTAVSGREWRSDF